jgi:hypothetical protein
VRDYYVFSSNTRKRSRYDSRQYSVLEIVSIDPADMCLKHYQTYVVSGYENYQNWRDILKLTQAGDAVWFTGDMRFRSQYTDPVQIDADSVPHIMAVLSVDQLTQYLEYHCASGIIRNATEIQMPEHMQTFFEQEPTWQTQH